MLNEQDGGEDNPADRKHSVGCAIISGAPEQVGDGHSVNGDRDDSRGGETEESGDPSGCVFTPNKNIRTRDGNCGSEGTKGRGLPATGV